MEKTNLGSDFYVISAASYTAGYHTINQAVGKGIFVGGSGNLVIVNKNGVEVTLSNVLGALPFVPAKIKESGTTATNILIWS